MGCKFKMFVLYLKRHILINWRSMSNSSYRLFNTSNFTLPTNS
eukprot:UN19834